MVNKNSSLFGDIANNVEGKKQVRGKGGKKLYLEERRNGISELVSGNIEEKTLIWVEPQTCKMWEHHNRRYDLLSEGRCADLIEGLKAQGRQEFPAIVRKIDDPTFEYEVICGARRHWAISFLRQNNYPSFKFLIEVRNLTDEEAFRISDIENRDRADISDYERALDYANAVSRYYKTQKEMAARLEVSEAWLSRYLDLAKLPKNIVNLFSDVTFLKLEHGRSLKKLLKDPKSRSQLEERIEKIQNLKLTSSDGGKAVISDVEIFTYLLSKDRSRVVQGDSKIRSYQLSEGGKEAFNVKANASGHLLLSIKPIKKEEKGELTALVIEALEEFL